MSLSHFWALASPTVYDDSMGFADDMHVPDSSTQLSPCTSLTTIAITVVDVTIVYSISVINREVRLPVTGWVVMLLLALCAGSTPALAYETHEGRKHNPHYSTGGSSMLSLLVVAAALSLGSRTRLHTTFFVAVILAVGAIVSFTPGLCAIFGLGKEHTGGTGTAIAPL
jgi:hypothetical protein